MVIKYWQTIAYHETRQSAWKISNGKRNIRSLSQIACSFIISCWLWVFDPQDDKYLYCGEQAGITVFDLATGSVKCRLPITTDIMEADALHAVTPPACIEDTRRILMVKHKGDLKHGDHMDENDRTGQKAIRISRVIIYDDGRYIIERTPQLLPSNSWRWVNRVAVTITPSTGGSSTPVVDRLTIIDLWPASTDVVFPVGARVGAQDMTAAEEAESKRVRHQLDIPLQRLSDQCLFKCADYQVYGHVAVLRCACRHLHIVSLRSAKLPPRDSQPPSSSSSSRQLVGDYYHYRVALPRLITEPQLPVARQATADRWRANYDREWIKHNDNWDMCISALTPNNTVRVAPDCFEFGETFFN
jgi:hypothetical protein